MNERNRAYTSVDFTRYHAGLMPPAEMHNLEKAALEDPFLADALEGYLHSPAVEKDIKELKSRLATKRGKKNIVTLPWLARNGWWRIAAIFVIIAGGYFFFSMNKRDTRDGFAKNEFEMPPASSGDNTFLRSDTVQSGIYSEKDLAAAFERQSKPPGSPVKQGTEDNFLPKKAKSSGSPAKGSTAESGIINDSVSFIAKEDKLKPGIDKEDVVEREVTDDKGPPVHNARISDKAQEKTNTAKRNGNFVPRSEDSNITATVSAEGRSPENFSLKADSQPMRSMSGKENNGNREVLKRINAERKAKTASAPTRPGEKALNLSVTTRPQPSGGLAKFNQYVQENMKALYNSDKQRLTGEVALSFSVGVRGRPQNIIIASSSCKECELEAIRLLKQGPDWIITKDKLARAVIKF